jgi:hypothetical protein
LAGSLGWLTRRGLSKIALYGALLADVAPLIAALAA